MLRSIGVGAAELQEGIATVVRVSVREVELVRWRDEVFAVRNSCPHMQASFLSGPVHQGVLAGATLGRVELDLRDAVIVCPWHTFEFNLRTGVCTSDGALRVKAYPTRVESGMIMIDLGRADAEREDEAAS